MESMAEMWTNEELRLEYEHVDRSSYIGRHSNNCRRCGARITWRDGEKEGCRVNVCRACRRDNLLAIRGLL